MQEPEPSNIVLLPIKRARDTNEQITSHHQLIFQKHPENFFKHFNHESGHSKVFWTLPIPSSQRELSEETNAESPVFSTPDREEWRIRVVHNTQPGNLCIQLEHVGDSQGSQRLCVNGGINLWVFKGSLYESLAEIKFKHLFCAENQVWEKQESLKVFKRKKVSKILLIELCIESKRDPEHFKAPDNCVGILDDGFSGAINCVIQSLFQLKLLRKTVLQLTEQDLMQNIQLRALKALFYNLNSSNFAPDPTEFIKTLNLSRDHMTTSSPQTEISLIVEEIFKIFAKPEKLEKKFLGLFSGFVKKKNEFRNSKYFTILNENFTEIYLPTNNCSNLYDCFDLLSQEPCTNGSEKQVNELIGVKSMKFLVMPDILVLVLRPGFGSQAFECSPELDLGKYTESESDQKFKLFSQIIQNNASYEAYISLSDSILKFENDSKSPLPSKSFIPHFPLEQENFEMQETGLVKTLTPNPQTPKVLIYIKSDQFPSIFQDFLSNPLPSPSFLLKEPKFVLEKDPIVEIPVVTLETILGWNGPGVLPKTSSEAFPQYSLQLPVPQKLTGRDLRIELSSHVTDDYRLWTFTPGSKNWEFKELKLNDLVFSDSQKAIFVEIILQKPVFCIENLKWKFIYSFDTSTKASLENEVSDENLEMLTPSSAKAIVFYKWYDWNKGTPMLTLFKMVTLTSTSNMSQIRMDMVNSCKHPQENCKMLLHLEKCKVQEYKNKESFSNVYSYRPDENYELTISKRGNFGVRHVIIDNGDAFIGESQPVPLPADYIDAKKYLSSFE